MKISDFDKDFQEKYRIHKYDKYAKLKGIAKYTIGGGALLGFFIYRKINQLPIEQ